MARAPFNSSAPPLSEPEQALKNLRVEYHKQPDGTIVVPGDINLSSKRLTQLPDLSTVIVKGSFYCYNNQLTNLKGAPRSVGGNFSCHNNQLTSLDHAPQSVRGDFYCYDDGLTSLEGAPQTVGGDFYCYNNQLTTLDHAPQAFKALKSDFGEFKSWNDIPEQLSISPETKARQESERKQALAVLRKRAQAAGPLRLKPERK